MINLMAIRLSTIACAMFILGCSGLPKNLPVIDFADTQLLIVTGYFGKGKHLPENPDCNTENEDGYITICLDPPPIALELRGLKVIYGEPIPERLIAFTTHHFGIEALYFGVEYPHLMALRTDGNSYFVPRYQYAELGYTEQGKLALPTLSDKGAVLWLPCEIKVLIEALDFTSQTNGNRHAIQESDIRSNQGITMSRLKEQLSRHSMQSIESGCDE